MGIVRFKDLISILDEHCFQQNQSSQRASSLSMYDFVYLPMDYKKFAYENKQSNLGYAFVNFTTARAAFLFFKRFNERKWPGHENWKFCEVAKAQIQGKEALMMKFKEKVFRCVHPSFRPVEYRPARDGANHEGIKGISVGKFERGGDA
ncbi:protein terminal ear1-like [Neltuma alba]|uniref:protein terminal ear1-like n=1 Tax=Neltuma alba TaxID=207710 RepID=UPI0010A56B15|nr:protein terminal ear1-like [Prosopis alba]